MIYPEGLAERLREQAGEKYRPSNGTEGSLFQEAFCDHCKREAGYRAGAGDGCPILAATMAFDVDDDNYPAEWQYGEDGQPKCTAFELDGGQ